MKKLLSVALVALVFTACKKDDPPAAVTGGKLDKIVQADGTDTTISTYKYDGNNRLISYGFYMKTGSGPITDSIINTMVRDANGRVIQITEQENQYPPTVIKITYNGTTDQLKTVVSSYGSFSSDSMHYVYSGNTLTEHHFYKSTGTWQPMGRMEYTFQNDNLTTVKEFATGGVNPEGTTTLTYDSKKTAYQRSKEEALVTGFWELGFANNITGNSSVYPANPTWNETVNVHYTYASSGLPLTAHATYTPGGTENITYYYK